MIQRASAKAKGSQAETDWVSFLRDSGFPSAERRVTNGAKDRGDISGIGPWVNEVKAEKNLSIPGALREASVEAGNAGVHAYAVVVRPPRVVRPRHWWFVMPFWQGNSFVDEDLWVTSTHSGHELRIATWLTAAHAQAVIEGKQSYGVIVKPKGVDDPLDYWFIVHGWLGADLMKGDFGGDQ